jgi:hypothetical protein
MHAAAGGPSCGILGTQETTGTSDPKAEQNRQKRKASRETQKD